MTAMHAMSFAMPSAPLLAACAVASLVLAATPGPGVLYIVTRTLSQGRRAGLASVAGVALGNLATALSWNACPYRANVFLHRRPRGSWFYGGDNYSDAGGFPLFILAM